MFSFSNYKFRQLINVVGGKLFFFCLLASLLTLAITSVLAPVDQHRANIESLVMVTAIFILSQVPVPVKVRNKTDVK